MSDAAIATLARAFEHSRRTLVVAIDAFANQNREKALQACRLEDEMDRLNLSARQGHVERLKTNSCDPEAGVLFVETLRNLERVGDHADNIALTVLRKT